MTDTDHFVFWLVAVATAVGLASAMIVWLCPRRWVAKNEFAIQVVPKGAPLPWSFSNSFGKTVWTCLYFSGALYVLAALLEYS